MNFIRKQEFCFAFYKIGNMLVIFGLLILNFDNLLATNCEISASRDLLACHHHLPDPNTPYPATIKTLQLDNIDWDTIDMEAITHRFPYIENMTIESGRLAHFKAPIGQFGTIRALTLNNMSVESISSQFLRHFPHLETLHLENNNIQGFHDNFTAGSVRNLYLADNKWNCSLDLEWVLRLNGTILRDADSLACFGRPHANRPLLLVAGYMHDMRAACPPPCACTLSRVRRRGLDDDALEPVVEVDCAGRGLRHLPARIPHATRILHAQGNDVEDVVGPLRRNAAYRSVVEANFDGNRVRTIDDLEGSHFLRQFRVLSLRGNRLSELPTYAMDNALMHNLNMPEAVRLNLGGNPWRCDCVFTPGFQDMLQKFAPQIRDLKEVKCSYVEGDENSLLPIVELSRSSVCRLPTEYSVKALNLLNAVLASLIAGILGKLAYDYYYFKKTGRLPWIVTKMP